MADEKFPVKQFLGGKIASQTQALAGMKGAEEELARRFAEATESQEARAKAMAPVQKSLGELGGADQTVAALQQLGEEYSTRTLEVPELAPEEERIFPGSVGLTRVPPYDYRWTWNAQDPGPTASVSANNQTGQLGFDLRSAGSRGHAWGANGVGVYYRPVHNGMLNVWSNPTFSYLWFTVGFLATCYADGWLGLYVGRYNLAGNLDWVPISWQMFQWRDDNWYSASHYNTGRNPGYPLSAWFPVDTSHYYAVWVWSGGSIYADGNGPLWTSSASSTLNVGVPSINMVLY